jgi:protein dithiol oxidoreductase (disulfide-forming)
MLVRTLAGLFGLMIAAAAAAADAPMPFEAGKQYFVIDPPLRVASGDKIEVTEVFSYGCPACNFAHTFVDKIAKGLPANAVMTYVPASFKPNEAWPMFQRAYLAAQALGVADKAHDAMFDAVWKPDAPLAIMNADGRTLKDPLPTIEDAAKFYARYGVKADEFVGVANSFSINTKMKQADAFVRDTGTDSTPTFVVGGKYRLTYVSAGADWKLLEQLIHYLVGQAAAGQ